MKKTITRPLKILSLLAFLTFSASLMSGCATFMNGVRQPLEVLSDDPVMVIVDNGEPQKTPAFLPLLRRNNYVLKLVKEGEADTALVEVKRKMSNWVWGNLAFLTYGLLGVPIDFLSGGAYRLEIKQEHQTSISNGVDLKWYPNPRSYGNWHMSLGFLAGAKSFSNRGTGPDFGMQLVAGATDWPLDLMAEGFFYSSTQDVLDWKTAVLLNAGVRKTLFRKSSPRIQPNLAAGLTLLSQSTQKNKGLPFGVWGRTGLDIRMNRFFVGPYLGYSKLEMVASSKDHAINTTGVTWGSVFGLMW